VFDSVVRLLLLAEVRDLLKALYNKKKIFFLLLLFFAVSSGYLVYYHMQAETKKTQNIRSSFLLHTLERRVVSKRIFDILKTCQDRIDVSWVKVITLEEEGRWIYIDTFQCKDGKCSAGYNECRQPLYRLDNITREKLDKIQSDKIFAVGQVSDLPELHLIDITLKDMLIIQKVIDCLDVSDFVHFVIKKDIKNDEFYMFMMSMPTSAINQSLLKCRFGLYDISRNVSLNEIKQFF
jgi:hypothetical protein